MPSKVPSPSAPPFLLHHLLLSRSPAFRPAPSPPGAGRCILSISECVAAPCTHITTFNPLPINACPLPHYRLTLCFLAPRVLSSRPTPRAPLPTPPRSHRTARNVTPPPAPKDAQHPWERGRPCATVWTVLAENTGKRDRLPFSVFSCGRGLLSPGPTIARRTYRSPSPRTTWECTQGHGATLQASMFSGTRIHATPLVSAIHSLSTLLRSCPAGNGVRPFAPQHGRPAFFGLRLFTALFAPRFSRCVLLATPTTLRPSDGILIPAPSSLAALAPSPAARPLLPSNQRGRRESLRKDDMSPRRAPRPVVWGDARARRLRDLPLWQV